MIWNWAQGQSQSPDTKWNTNFEILTLENERYRNTTQGSFQQGSLVNLSSVNAEHLLCTY